MTEVSRKMAQLSRQDRALLFERLRQKEREKPAAERQSWGIERRKGDAPPPLSFSQQRLWFIDRLQPGDPAYNVASVLRITGDLGLAALRRALSAVAARHESLRTTFGMAGAEPVQIVAPHLDVAVPLIDLSGLAAADADPPELRRLYMAETERSFDLARGPLLRFLLLRLGPRHHVLSIVLHHIVSDGWSMSVMVRETAAFYEAFTAGGTGVAPSLPELPIQYPDFAVWQRSRLQGEVLGEHISYWRERLAGAPSSLDLPADRPRPAVRSNAGASYKGLKLRGAWADRLRRLAREVGGTPFVVLLGAFQAVLHHHTGEEDVCVGTAVANRNRVETSGLIGFFVNSLVLRGDLSGDPTFRELLAQLRKVSIDAFSHQDLPFEKLVEELKPERDPSRSPVFQVMLILQNTPRATLQAGDLVFDDVPLPSQTAKIDLTLSVTEDPEEGFFGRFEYSTALFDRTTLLRFADCTTTLLEGALSDPDRRLSELPVLPAAELSQVITGWNDTRADFSRRCLHELVEEQADRTPDAVAVEWEGGRLTYAELEDRAARLARHLRRLGVRIEEAVGLCAERSPELIAGMLGVLKAGAAWLPLDPAQPEERLAAMAEDAGARVLLIQEPLLQRFPSLAEGRRAVFLDEDLSGEGGRFPSGASPGSLAYVIFTSGSTGRPKGVMVPHRGVCNRLLWAQEVYRLDGRDAGDAGDTGDAVLQIASIGFDFSVWECFAPLVAGARLVLARPEGHRDVGYLARAIAEHGVTFVHFAPSMLAVFLEQEGLEQEGLERGAGGMATLRQVFTGGEALLPELRDRARARLGVSLHNEYGPTEASIDVTSSACDPEALSGGHRVPIGRPISNLRAYVVSRRLKPVPIGAPGELLVGGAGLARGYAGRPELTAERFIPDAFAETGGEAGGRLYRTGDLARWLADGELELLGRIDRQVKVRGVRIEPGEIEAALAQHPEVTSAVVVPWPHAGTGMALAAYVVPASPGLAVEELRRFLAARLPAVMIPSGFVLLEALPHTPNGKVDRRRLPPPERPEHTAFVPPGAGAESELAEIWAEALGREKVGRDDNFFDLGGHSLLLARVQTRVRERLGEEVPLLAFFEHPTVGALAAYLKGGTGEGTAEESRDRILRQRQGLELQRQRMTGRRGR